jgi:hypothetical protein
MVARCSCTHRTRHCPLWTFCFPFSKKMDFLFGSHGYFLFACCLLYELSEAVAFNHGSRQGYHRLLHCHGFMGGAYCDHRFFLGARNQPIFRVVLVLVPVTSTVLSRHYAVQLRTCLSDSHSHPHWKSLQRATCRACDYPQLTDLFSNFSNTATTSSYPSLAVDNNW